MELWQTILLIVLPTTLSGIGTLVLFSLKEKSEKTRKEVEAEKIRAEVEKTRVETTGLRITNSSILQATLDALSQQYDRSRETIARLDVDIDALREKVDRLQTSLDEEKSARILAEKDNAELRRGIGLLIVQMRRLNIEPVWEPAK